MRIVDANWNKIFEKHDVVKQIKDKGYFMITSTEINLFKEARLMTKFDQEIHLPIIFKKNNLSILPTKRGEYIIGPFQTHQSLPLTLDERPKELSGIALETLNRSNLYSEASAILYAFNSGLFEDFLGTEAFMTVNGRMSSGVFDFDINSSIEDAVYNIPVENSQIEIDGGFETEHSFVVVEAKNIRPSDFLIRQLYYPYRLWMSKVQKSILPIFMSYSDDVYNVHMFDFNNPMHYNSLYPVKQKSYTTKSARITIDDVVRVWKGTKIVPESKEVTFPQANTFERVLDMMSILSEGPQTTEEITPQFMLDSRQTQYYVNACRYLGLADRKKVQGNAYTFFLTDKAESIMKMHYKQRILVLVSLILSPYVINKAFSYRLIQGTMMSDPELERLLTDSGVEIGNSTIPRRVSTIKGWINWIFKKIDD